MVHTSRLCRFVSQALLLVACVKHHWNPDTPPPPPPHAQPDSTYPGQMSQMLFLN